ncbi:MAG: hypothetical protein ACPIOQ_71390, partial [Promethearchaeia archaeon]
GNPLTFPGPEVYEKGGNPAVLKFIRDVYRTAEESREMREAREGAGKFRAQYDAMVQTVEALTKQKEDLQKRLRC